MEMKTEGRRIEIEKQSVMEKAFLDCQKTVLQLFLYDGLSTEKQRDEAFGNFIGRQKLM